MRSSDLFVGQKVKAWSPLYDVILGEVVSWEGSPARVVVKLLQDKKANVDVTVSKSGKMIKPKSLVKGDNKEFGITNLEPVEKKEVEVKKRREPKEKPVYKQKSDYFSSITFSFTGKIKPSERKIIERTILEYQGNLVRVSKDTNILIIGDEPNENVMKWASDKDIYQINEKDFLKSSIKVQKLDLILKRTPDMYYKGTWGVRVDILRVLNDFLKI